MPTIISSKDRLRNTTKIATSYGVATKLSQQKHVNDKISLNFDSTIHVSIKLYFHQCKEENISHSDTIKIFIVACNSCFWAPFSSGLKWACHFVAEMASECDVAANISFCYLHVYVSQIMWFIIWIKISSANNITFYALCFLARVKITSNYKITFLFYVSCVWNKSIFLLLFCTF